MPIEIPKSKADVLALPMNPITKLILTWILDQPEARPFERSEISKALGLNIHVVEDSIAHGMTKAPACFSRVDENGKNVRPTIAIVPESSFFRAAWSPPKAPTKAAPKPEAAKTEPPKKKDGAA